VVKCEKKNLNKTGTRVGGTQEKRCALVECPYFGMVVAIWGGIKKVKLGRRNIFSGVETKRYWQPVKRATGGFSNKKKNAGTGFALQINKKRRSGKKEGQKKKDYTVELTGGRGGRKK